MTATQQEAAPLGARSGSHGWTCPFCPLLCDDLQPDPAAPAVPASDCPLASRQLSAHCGAALPSPRVDGRDVSLDEAIEAAAGILAASRQPLMAGLGADVAGARALFRLAAATGAICDAAGGEALSQALRAQQDRGGFTLTLGEIRERADLVLFVGSWPLERAPRLLARMTRGRSDPPALVVLGADAELDGVEAILPGVALADSLPMLAALVSRRHLRQPNPELQILAERLRGARYPVLVWEPGQLGAHAALLIELAQRIVATLNESGRAAGFPLAGGNGVASANQVFTWLGGLPLRTRVGADGLRHEPLRHDAARLLAAGEVDAMLWANPFDGPRPPQTSIPRVVLGPPGLLEQLGDESGTVYIPVATPGLQHGGHLFRTDGVVLMPVFALRADGLPSIAELAGRLASELEGRA